MHLKGSTLVLVCQIPQTWPKKWMTGFRIKKPDAMTQTDLSLMLIPKKSYSLCIFVSTAWINNLHCDKSLHQTPISRVPNKAEPALGYLRRWYWLWVSVWHPEISRQWKLTELIVLLIIFEKLCQVTYLGLTINEAHKVTVELCSLSGNYKDQPGQSGKRRCKGHSQWDCCCCQQLDRNIHTITSSFVRKEEKLCSTNKL